jgi:SAM-dependent methyltransferase
MEEAEYAKLADTDDRMWYFRGLHALIERELVAGLGQGSRSAILDAGCGAGGLIRRLSDRRPHWRWSGLDLSPAACGLARKRTGVEVVEASVEALPFADESLDAVVSADVLYHVDDDLAALREFYRVLRPGGWVVLNVPAYSWLWSYHDVAVHGRRRYTRGQMLDRLTAAGFESLRGTYWNTLLFPLAVMRRKLLPAPRSGSDVRLYSPPMEWVGNAALTVERCWLRAFGRLPFGLSVFAAARKPSRSR